MRGHFLGRREPVPEACGQTILGLHAPANVLSFRAADATRSTSMSRADMRIAHITRQSVQAWHSGSLPYRAIAGNQGRMSRNGSTKAVGSRGRREAPDSFRNRSYQ
jgi:hypothetical protein